MSLKNCIEKLRKESGKPHKFGRLEKIYQNRNMLTFTINVGNIGNMKLGFDNHFNHQAPHIHCDIKKDNIGKISIEIETGELFHKNSKKIKPKILNEIKEWVLNKKECLKLIYNNIQKCQRSEDFEPLIDAINKYL